MLLSHKFKTDSFVVLLGKSLECIMLNFIKLDVYWLAENAELVERVCIYRCHHIGVKRTDWLSHTAQ